MDRERKRCFGMACNIQLIGEWIRNESLFLGRTDRSFITMYLEACNNDVEKTKRRIVRYYELRNLYPRLTTNRDCLNEKYAKLIRQQLIYSDVVNENVDLPVMLTVTLSRLEHNDCLWDVTHFVIFAIESGILDSSRFRKYGGMAIFDFEDVKFTHALQVTPNLVMQILKCLFEGVPVKCCALLFINVGSIVRAAISVGSLFLSTEIRNIITISSGSWDSVRDKAPPQCLPIEYGGTNGTLEDNMKPIEAVFMRWRDYLLDDERYGFNE